MVSSYRKEQADAVMRVADRGGLRQLSLAGEATPGWRWERRLSCVPRLGASAYALAYGAVGFIFRDFVAKIVSGFRAAGHAVEIVIIVAVIAFIGYRVSLYWKQRADRVVPRVQVAALVAKLHAEGPGKILLADVRSYGYYSAGALRIPGSIRIEPNNLSAEVKQFPRNKDMYLYCTCRSQVTSASVAHLLRQKGFSAFVIDGGLAAWRRARNPLEPVPKTDLVHLPTFS